MQHLVRVAPALLSLALATSACANLFGQGPGGPAASAASTGPAATPSATPDASPGPAGRHVVGVEVAPPAATVYVAPPRDKTPAHATSVQLSATVRFSDGSTDSAVVWRSGEGDRAIVDESGRVSAGLEPGTVKIFADTPDGGASGFATVTVLRDAAAEVDVE